MTRFKSNGVMRHIKVFILCVTIYTQVTSIIRDIVTWMGLKDLMIWLCEGRRTEGIEDISHFSGEIYGCFHTKFPKTITFSILF